VLGWSFLFISKDKKEIGKTTDSMIYILLAFAMYAAASTNTNGFGPASREVKSLFDTHFTPAIMVT
jgi:hypothetical protein